MQPRTPELWHTGTQPGASTVLISVPPAACPALQQLLTTLREAAEPCVQPRPAGIWQWFQQPRTNSDYKPFILGFTCFSELPFLSQALKGVSLQEAEEVTGTHL